MQKMNNLVLWCYFHWVVYWPLLRKIAIIAIAADLLLLLWLVIFHPDSVLKALEVLAK